MHVDKVLTTGMISPQAMYQKSCQDSKVNILLIYSSLFFLVNFYKGVLSDE